MNSVRKNARLLQTILAIRPSIGDGFSDDELTQLLRTTLLGPEILRDLSVILFSGHRSYSDQLTLFVDSRRQFRNMCGLTFSRVEG